MCQDDVKVYWILFVVSLGGNEQETVSCNIDKKLLNMRCIFGQGLKWDKLDSVQV